MLQRDNSLLGPTPRDPFEASNSYRKSDADFADVFGGPPRKSSIYDYSRSSGESADVYGREESVRSRWPRTSLEGSPVFGECLSPSTRRRDLGDDFFSDIFRGSHSVCSSPKKADRDIFSSASSSRVLSPVRPLPPRSEAFSGSSSLPSPLSFKLSHFSREVPKGQENYVSSPELTPNRSKGSKLNAKTDVASAVKQASESHDDPENNAHASIFHTSLSSRFTCDEEPPKSTKSATVDFERPFAKDPKVNNRPGQFHFSIYRWAGKGVMLVVPPNTREGAKSERRLAGIPVPFLQGVELPSSNKVNPSEYLHKGSTKEVNLKKTTKKSPTNRNEVLPQKLESDNFPSENTEPGKPFENRQAVPDSKNNTGTFNKINEVPAPMQDVQMPTQWNLRDLMNGHYSTEENEEKFSKEEDDMVSTATSTRSTQSPAELKWQTSKTNVMGQSGTQDMSVEEEMLAGRVKGKVKDFIRIFNEDISCKPADIIESLSRSTKTRTSGKDKVEECDNGVQLDATVLIQKDLEDEKLQFITETLEQEKYKSFKEKRGTSPSFESMSFDASFAEEPHYEVEEILVENVLQEPRSVDTPKIDLSLEEIQISDLKVREWSRGKEGNIRSLLSTLQFVLWTGSGWKPVALVDILEGASVKRAYQKALLCLHPDKLQQRGAPKHQKYIAEKVFDILQEAWDHFINTNAF